MNRKRKIIKLILVGIVAILIIVTGGIIYFNTDDSLDENDETLIFGFIKTDAHNKNITNEKQEEADEKNDAQNEIERQREQLNSIENSPYASQVNQINENALSKMSEKADEMMADRSQLSYIGDFVGYTTSTTTVTLEAGDLKETAEEVTIDHNYYGRLYSYVLNGETHYDYIELGNVKKDGTDLKLNDMFYGESSWTDCNALKEYLENYSTKVNWNF